MISPAVIIAAVLALPFEAAPLADARAAVAAQAAAWSRGDLEAALGS